MGLFSGIGTMVGLGGDNPKKLGLINIDPTNIQSQTIAGNTQNAPAAFDLARMANAFSAEELNKALERMIPGYASMRDKATGIIQSELSGEIPKDVERLLQQRAAEKGFTLGTSGSGMQKFDLLRNLGLTSLGLTQHGVQAAQNWIGSAPKAPQFNYSQMFFTPQERLGFAFNQAQANLPIRKFNNWVDSLPSNVERGGMEMLQWLDSFTSTTDILGSFGQGQGGSQGPVQAYAKSMGGGGWQGPPPSGMGGY